MKLSTVIVAGILTLAFVSIAQAKASTQLALKRQAAAQMATSRQHLRQSVQSICQARPQLCQRNSRQAQLSCPRMSCRLPRNPGEVLDHAACIEKWLLGCL
jgi:hypothetical protein